MAVPGRPPDIVVVVLDCVRAADFVGGSPGIGGMPFCEELRRESIAFPRAISPSPWTIPSHATIFTGLPPWETGCHWKGSLQLADRFSRVPAVLQEQGYRTMSLSANPLIEPSFGLVEGFQQVAWSGWWEPFLRYATPHPPHGLPASKTGVASRLAARRQRKGPVDFLIKKVRPSIIQHPVVMVAGNRFVHGLRQERGEETRSIARWLEPTFADWVGGVPHDQPLYAFINLLDAHEPYFPDGDRLRGLSKWRDYAATRQDPVAWMNGDWKATAENFELIHDLYREMIAGMDRRLRGIVDALKANGRWDRTALIVTGDHGQAFGEHGTLFHFFRVDEQLVRVPMWLRLPGGAQGGTEGRGWASLVDIAPTVFELSGRPRSVHRSAYSLTSLTDAERPEPAVAISDGIVWGHFRSRFRPEGVDKFDRVYAAAYSGDWKVVADMRTNSQSAYDVARDPGETRNEWTDSDALSRLSVVARAAGARTTSGTPSELTEDVEDRLTAWGYV